MLDLSDLTSSRVELMSFKCGMKCAFNLSYTWSLVREFLALMDDFSDMGEKFFIILNFFFLFDLPLFTMQGELR